MVKPRLFIRYIKAIGHSRGFGIQSPFAYNFIKDLRSVKKSKTKSESIINHIKRKYGERVIIADASAAMTEAGRANEQTILVVKGIYKNKQSHRVWQTLCKEKKATVTFDLYHLGIIFFEQGLSKKNYIAN